MKKINYKNIDFSMIHLNIGNKDGDVRINTDKLPKALYNDVQGFIIDGYEPDIEQDAVTYDVRIDSADKELLQELIELMTERLTLCRLRRNNTFISVYDNLISKANKRLSELKETPKQVFPKELQTDRAKEIFQKAIELGFMNEDFSFNGTKYQKAYFAEYASNELRLTKYRYRVDGKTPYISWKPFETLWGCKGLAQTRRESKERFGYVDKQDEIDLIFE